MMAWLEFLGAKPVPGAVGYYATPDGSVYSARRKTIIRLKPTAYGKRGYLGVSLGGKNKTYLHHVIAKTFLGPRPHGMEIAHKNGDKKNCAVTNLEYKTHAANMADNVVHGVSQPGSKNARAKLTEVSVAEIKLILARGDKSHSEIAASFGVTQATVALIANGTTWRHVANPAGYDSRNRKPGPLRRAYVR